MPDVVREPASAKINPFLRVLRRRDDAFHDIETLILPTTLADGVEARRAGGLTLAVAGPRAKQVPAGEDNLVLRATRALAEEAGVEPAAAMLLAKQVPVAAGLGGGSADAAATLRALNDLWELGWPRERLADVGAQVGSDVPALVDGGPVFVRGRGERLESVTIAKTWWVLVTQEFGVSSADAYAWWDEEPVTGPDPGPLLAALAGGDIERAGAMLFNDLQPGVERRHPEIAHARERLVDAGALGAIMSGSGPSVAGLCRDADQSGLVGRAVGGLVVGGILPSGRRP